MSMLRTAITNKGLASYMCLHMQIDIVNSLRFPVELKFTCTRYGCDLSVMTWRLSPYVLKPRVRSY